MATSPALIDVVVAMTGETKAAVSVALSRLRKANLVPVRGRGPYAIPMDAEAAMRLLTAVCASVVLEPNSATNAVQRFEGLPSRLPEIEGGSSARKTNTVVMPIDELPKGHTFGQALKRIIEAGGKDELFTYIDADSGKRKQAYRNPEIRGYLTVQFMLPLPQVRIEHQFGAWLRKTWIYGEQPIDFESYNGACRSLGLGDRARLITISEATIEEIGKTVFS